MIPLTKTGNVGRLAKVNLVLGVEFEEPSTPSWKPIESPWKQRCGAYKTGKNHRQWNQVSAQKEVVKCKRLDHRRTNLKRKYQQQNFPGMALSGIRKKEVSGTQKCSCKKPCSEYIFHKCVEWLIHMRIKHSIKMGKSTRRERTWAK